MGTVEALGASKPLYAAPFPITADHKLDGFESGKPALDDWLRAHAMESAAKASRTYVVTAKAGEDAGRVVAYSTLAYGSVIRSEIPKKNRQGLPNPVPVMVLGRLAVDQHHARKGVGPSLLREAMQRTVEAAQVSGLRAPIVHALDDDAVGFLRQVRLSAFSGRDADYGPADRDASPDAQVLTLAGPGARPHEIR